MTHAKRVIFALISFWKSTESLVLSVRDEIVAPASENLMSVGLVTHVPNQLIVRGIIYIMECYGKFYHAQAGAKMAAIYAYHINDILAQFIAHLVQLLFADFL